PPLAMARAVPPHSPAGRLLSSLSSGPPAEGRHSVGSISAPAPPSQQQEKPHRTPRFRAVFRGQSSLHTKVQRHLRLPPGLTLPPRRLDRSFVASSLGGRLQIVSLDISPSGRQSPMHFCPASGLKPIQLLPSPFGQPAGRPGPLRFPVPKHRGRSSSMLPPELPSPPAPFLSLRWYGSP